MKQMFTDYQLSNFSRYLKETPKHMLGIDPGPVLGAYDAIGPAGGARAHGFRRGINMRQFAWGGAFDAENGENENNNMSKSGQTWVALEKYLSQILSTEQMAEVGSMIEDLCHHAKSEAMNGEDDDPDAEAMDKPRRGARDNPPPFANGGRPNPGGRVDPADPMNGRAGDGRNRRALAVDSTARASFDALFPGASHVQRL
jgi:hypothetical protein